MRKPKPKEESEWWVKKQVKPILEDAGWKFWMPNAGAFGLGGVSDFLAVKQPRLFMAIETKYEDVVTQLQFEFLTNVHEAGHYAFLVDETNIEVLRTVLMSGILIEPGEYESLMKWKDQKIKPFDIRISKTEND